MESIQQNFNDNFMDHATNSPPSSSYISGVEKSESQSSVTFSIPQVPLKSENGEMMATVEEDGQCLKANDQCLSYDAQAVVEEPPRTSCDVVSMEHQPNINSRRQSTRNRPLSLRALESLETFIQTN
ncbi:hypothetical protein GYH30_054008 [Glycine max]|nr:hypothetical protein GYH30_054008 [Glycine max]